MDLLACFHPVRGSSGERPTSTCDVSAARRAHDTLAPGRPALPQRQPRQVGPRLDPGGHVRRPSASPMALPWLSHGSPKALLWLSYGSPEPPPGPHQDPIADPRPSSSSSSSSFSSIPRRTKRYSPGIPNRNMQTVRQIAGLALRRVRSLVANPVGLHEVHPSHRIASSLLWSTSAYSRACLGPRRRAMH